MKHKILNKLKKKILKRLGMTHREIRVADFGRFKETCRCKI